MPANAFEVAPGKIGRPSIDRFRVALISWWTVWLLILLFVFSGIQISIGPVEIKTLVLDWTFIAAWWPFISRGIIMTLELSVISMGGAVVLAFVAALARLSHVAPLNSFASLYVSLMRGTPLFLQLTFIYFALPQLGLVLSGLQAAVLALSLNYGAYMSEIFRAGIQAVGRAQSEAAAALGMTPWQTMRRIVLPQALRIITPDIGNQFVGMPKDTALASALALPELMGLAKQAGTPHQRYFEALVVASVWYWLITIILTYFQGKLEHRMSRGDR